MVTSHCVQTSGSRTRLGSVYQQDRSPKADLERCRQCHAFCVVPPLICIHNLHTSGFMFFVSAQWSRDRTLCRDAVASLGQDEAPGRDRRRSLPLSLLRWRHWCPSSAFYLPGHQLDNRVSRGREKPHRVGAWGAQPAPSWPLPHGYVGALRLGHGLDAAVLTPGHLCPFEHCVLGGWGWRTPQENSV